MFINPNRYGGLVLSDRDRTLLAPHLALLRTAQRELAAAKSAFEEAERQLAESTTGTDWRDRTLGGLLSIDEGRARRLRQARAARKAAGTALAAAESRHTTYAERMDGLLEPILIRDDPAYQAKLAAVRRCDKALRACGEIRYRLTDALTKPSRYPQQGRSEPGTQRWHEAEFARLRFDGLLAELRSSVPELRRTIDRAARAVGEAGRAEVDTIAPTAPGPAAVQQLHALQRQVEAAFQEISRWRARAEKARVAALRAAPDAL